MKINKYLKELGYEWYDLPGNYDKKLKEDEELSSSAAADCRNEENDEGFCGYEFFNLDNTLSLFIYSKLCFFREHIVDMTTPGAFISFSRSDDEEIRKQQEEEGHQLWLTIVDKMIEAFRIKLKGYRKGYEGIDAEKEREGMQLFIEYYDNLWY